MLLAHGIGGVQSLPLDPVLVLQTGGVVVLVSFVAVAMGWRRPRFAGPVPGRPLPAWLDAPAVRTGLQAVALLVAAVVVVAGLFGPQEAADNPAPRALYVLFWVGIVPLSLLCGPVWRVANPLRLLHRGLAALLRRPTGGPPPRLGYRPAALGLLLFTGLELVAPARDVPAVVAGFLLGYAALHLLAALRYGAGWFDRADAFEVYSALAGALAPVGRLAGGRIGLRNPLRGPATIPVGPGLVAYLAVWWGSTVFDGLSGWPGWSFAGRSPLTDAVVALALVALVGGLYRLATGSLSGQLAGSLVPIAVGYTLAHYATLLLVEGPRGLAQLGAALLAPTAPAPLGPVTAVPAPTTVAAIQIGAVLLGHVVGVLVAHDRSVALLPPERRLVAQVPLVLLMVGYTMVGLFLLVTS